MSSRTRRSEACGVVELRRYTLHAGERETLIELFERVVETQEAVGMRVLGTFRDAGDPDCFVWIRGFTDMAARPTALQAFYGGPVWAEHRKRRERDHGRQRQRPAAAAGRPGVALRARSESSSTDGRLAGDPEILRLQPTSRSLLPD